MEQLSLWRIYDPNPSEHPGCLLVQGKDDETKYREAHRFNADHWGIYRTVNSFEGPRRIENLKKLNAWYVECDDGDKKQMLKKLRKSLLPSKIIESKRGYHAYWNCKEATLEKYCDILEFRLIPFFAGDPKAKDVSRVLRVPDYFHCKDPNDKFLIRTVFEKDTAYTEADIEYCFKLPEKREETVQRKSSARKEMLFHTGGALFEKIYQLNCEEALQRLSGHAAVGGDRFEFKKTAGGNLNLIINGKSSSCWIDAQKRIGSTDHGGPTIWQWVNWYHHDHKRTYAYIKEIFPELL